MRGRGLKQILAKRHQCGTSVAPYAGAWIETFDSGIFKSPNIVAPYAGAWIETLFRRVSRVYQKVAPYAGAWIETGI